MICSRTGSWTYISVEFYMLLSLTASGRLHIIDIVFNYVIATILIVSEMCFQSGWQENIIY